MGNTAHRFRMLKKQSPAAAKAAAHKVNDADVVQDRDRESVSQEAGEPSSSSTGMIIGIAIGVAVIAGGLGAFAGYAYGHRSGEQTNPSQNGDSLFKKSGGFFFV